MYQAGICDFTTFSVLFLIEGPLGGDCSPSPPVDAMAQRQKAAPPKWNMKLQQRMVTKQAAGPKQPKLTVFGKFLCSLAFVSSAVLCQGQNHSQHQFIITIENTHQPLALDSFGPMKVTIFVSHECDKDGRSARSQQLRITCQHETGRGCEGLKDK